jgi:hypothetical protein
MEWSAVPELMANITLTWGNEGPDDETLGAWTGVYHVVDKGKEREQILAALRTDLETALIGLRYIDRVVELAKQRAKRDEEDG